MKPILFALLTGFFWGTYGPALGPARTALASPFKPYVAIGAAYLVWGILGGLLGMWWKGDTFTFSGAGASWGFIAGSLGAWGALALTFAMFTGGTAMPHIVMPIVFGGAVTVTAIISSIQQRQLPVGLVIGIAVVFVGVVLVTINTPQQHPPSKRVSQTGASEPDRH